MLNFDSCDSSVLDVTAHVVHAMQHLTNIDPAAIMVVGCVAAVRP